MTSTQQQYDVLVVGGGPAGLAAALTLSRVRRSVLVVDAGQPRNAAAEHIHAFLSRDGLPPAELLRLGRAEVEGYGGTVVEDRVVALRRSEGVFRATTAAGRVVLARRVVLATGLRDELPDLPGLAERFGRDVVHCPFCHGWEVRDQRIGVLASGPMSGHQVLLFRQLSDDVIFLAGDAPVEAEEDAALRARDIAVRPGRVTRLVVENDRLVGVQLADGATVPIDALVVATRMEAPTDLAEQVGADVTDLPGIGRHVTVDEQGRSSAEGVWVAGNSADVRQQVISAAASGNVVGATVAADLVDQEVAVAIARSAAARA